MQLLTIRKFKREFSNGYITSQAVLLLTDYCPSFVDINIGF